MFRRWFSVVCCSFSLSALAQDPVPSGPTFGPFSIKPDTESLAGMYSWNRNGRGAAQALMYEVPQANGTTRKLFITPYEFGLCIEYDGVMEFWVDKFSVHNNFRRGSLPRPPELWVGDPLDEGGLLLQGMQDFTVVNGTPIVSRQWVEVVATTFGEGGAGRSHGDIRYIVRGTQDRHEWRGGPKGAEVVYGSIGADGLKVGGIDLMQKIAALEAKVQQLETR